MWCKGYRGLCAGCIQVEGDEQFFEDDEDEKEDDVGDDEHEVQQI